MAPLLVRILLDVINTDLLENSACVKFEEKMNILSFKVLHEFEKYSYLELKISATNLS